MAQEGGNTTVNNTPEKKKKGKGVVIIILVLVAAAVAGLVYYLTHRKTATPEEELERGVITEDNVDEIMEQMQNAGPVDVSYYTVTMSTEWHFEDGTATSYDAYVENSTQNKTPVYFDVFLAEDEENPIYQSPVIPLGKQLDKIKLDKDLDPGTYDCVLIYHLVDDDQNTLSTLRISIKITIEG